MKTFISALSIMMIAAPLFAQPNKKELDKNAIKSMAGCYKVTFDYAETFPEDTSYSMHDRYHAVAPAEWIFVDEESDNKLVLQHLLVINDTMIIKHWRQDWLFENTSFHQYYKGLHWKYQEYPIEEVHGQWTQKVYQVDDGPRYQGTATWIHEDGRHYWESVADAPLPRREYTKRDDYNVMERTNRHELTAYGWVHEQDNKKIIRLDGEDQLLVEEKGYNRYYKIDENNCKTAREWWEENGAYWKLVREEWDNVFAKNEDLTLSKKVNDKFRWQALFELAEKSSNNMEKQEVVRDQIGEIIHTFEEGATGKEKAAY